MNYMAQSFQKSAKPLIELSPPHSGILDQHKFSTHFELHCYQPQPNLQQFVAHIWVQRPRQSLPKDYRPLELFSGPNVYLFLTAKTGFIHGITSGTFRYDPHDTVIGVKFRPGAFYAFWPHVATNLTEKTMPASAVFPMLTNSTRAALLTKSDQQIISFIEALLLAKNPKYNDNIAQANSIIDRITTDNTPTVKSIAQTYNINERSLQFLFQTRVGVGLKWIIMRQRLLRTVHAATASPAKATWTDAALRQGFSSQSHFTREFKRNTGISPSSYAKSLRS